MSPFFILENLQNNKVNLLIDSNNNIDLNNVIELVDFNNHLKPQTYFVLKCEKLRLGQFQNVYKN